MRSGSDWVKRRFLAELHSWLDDALHLENALDGQSIPAFLASLPQRDRERADRHAFWQQQKTSFIARRRKAKAIVPLIPGLQ